MKTERVDDMVLLASIFDKSNLSSTLDEYYPTHGNWEGVSKGKIITAFMIYVLSTSDHRLSHVEQWASDRLNVLKYVLKCPDFRSKDMSDDHLGDILDVLGEDSHWSKFESAINKGIIDVYNLKPEKEVIRLDATIAQSFKDPGGLFQVGYSKQHRPDLPQLKIMLATLDPLSMPLFSLIVSGNTSDDVLYEPIEQAVMDNLGTENLFFVGDCKMSSLKNRLFLSQNKHYYLCPLSKTQCPETKVHEYLAQKDDNTIESVYSKGADGKQKQVRAKVFELDHDVLNPETGEAVKERHLVIYSPSFATSQSKSFESGLKKTEQELKSLFIRKQGKARIETKEEAKLRAKEILEEHRALSFISVEIKETIKAVEMRKYGNRQPETRQKSEFELILSRNEAKIEKHKEVLGWRVYATNAPKDRISSIEAVECYRNEYKIEHKFDELLNKITTLVPIFLQKESRIIALIRFLLLALKFGSLIQYQARTNLKETGQSIKELYAGNPKRATSEPTTKQLLEAFKNITLVFFTQNNQTYAQITNLKPIHKTILQLLNLDIDTYSKINQFSFSGVYFSET